ncbi:hypothetical protein GCM10010372_65700 [Streptomyces tauricus]|nr:hypothetical protein GCM10010372_65700 [Streptomyces tauricus]
MRLGTIWGGRFVGRRVMGVRGEFSGVGAGAGVPWRSAQFPAPLKAKDCAVPRAPGGFPNGGCVSVGLTWGAFITVT